MPPLRVQYQGTTSPIDEKAAQDAVQAQDADARAVTLTHDYVESVDLPGEVEDVEAGNDGFAWS